MLTELGVYEPFGQKFLKERPHLGEVAHKDPVVDFSSIDTFDFTTPSPKTIHKLFSVTDNLTTDIGDHLDERSLLSTGELANPAIELEQEVYVRDSTVVWSRAGHIIKTFDYSEEDQPIQQVLFAWFPVTSTFFKSDPTNKPVNDAVLNNLYIDKYIVEGYWEKKGPQSIINLNNKPTEQQQQEEGGNEQDEAEKRPRPLNIPDIPEKDRALQRRALCIVFRDYIKVHCEDGINVTAHTPFEIDNVVPLDMGVLVSKKCVPEKIRKGISRPRSSSVTSLASLAGLSKKPAEDTPSFFVTITHPLKGACPVKSKDVHRNGITTVPEPLISPQRILFATTKLSNSGRLPVIVTLNFKEHRHYIWTYERRKDKHQHPSSSTTATASTNISPMKRKPSHTTMPTLKRQMKSSAMPYNRSKKLKLNTRGNAQFHEDYISDDEVIHENETEKDIYNELLDPSEISLRLLWREPTFKFPAKLKTPRNIVSEAFMIHDINGSEMICIMNHTLGSLQVINLSKATQLLSNCIELKIPVKSAIPIIATRDNYSDLLYLDVSNTLRLFIDQSMPRFRIGLDGITKLIDPVYDRFTAVSEKGMRRYQLRGRPEMSLVRDCFAAIDCASPLYFPKIWHRFLHLRQQPPIHERIIASEWETFFVSLMQFLKLQKQGYYYREANTQNLSSREVGLQQIRASNIDFFTKELGLTSANCTRNYNFLLDENYFQGIHTRWIDEILYNKDELDIMDTSTFVEIFNSLHVVYEDYRIKRSTALQANLLGYLLMQCAIILKNNSYIEYYTSHGIEPKFTGNLCLVDSDIVGEIAAEPPNVQICLRQMASNSTLLSFFGVNTLEPSLGHFRYTYAKTIKDLWALYGGLNQCMGDKSVLLERMIMQCITRNHIELLDDSIAKPILEALNELKQNPLVHWIKEAYNVIGRDDIYQQLQMKTTVCDPNTDTFKLPFQKDDDQSQSMHAIMKGYSTTHVTKCTFESDVLNMETERLRFGFGGFIEKVRIMLDAAHIPDHVLPEQPDLSDDDLAAEHQFHTLMLIQRTLALATGRGIYAYGTHVPDLTKVLPLEPIITAAKILPLRTVITLDSSSWSKEFLHWPQFHNGVAAGLRISPSNHVNDSWIDFCFPSELEPQHGGVLLALGLNGTLKKLPLVYWYRFITQTCDLVSIGFILAAAVAYRGTKDIQVTKYITVHIPALLPPESANLNQSNLIQATALLGMGLVYMNSCDRRISLAMLREISKNAYTDPSILDENYEGSALAAGFSLGFITLGMGQDALRIIDPQLRNNLKSLMTGRVSEDTTSSINLDITSPGATVALALMYLRTENRRVAEGIELLETRPYLNYIRPDFLLMRVVAKNLIMWSTIQPTDAWIDSQVPDFVVNDSEEQHHHHHQPMEEEVRKQAMYNIICGACLCIGLRFAGSKNSDAFRCLLLRLDHFIKLSHVTPITPQQSITECVVRTCVDVLCTAAAMVMAGTGNRDLLSRLEHLYQQVNADISYGNHMAISMSMGMLFMGLGGYTLTTTNEAIAGLLCAFYPFYPLSTEDNRYHLQAFRHLWVLAVDSRWLMPFDVESKKPCRVPMNLEIYDDDGASDSQEQVRQVRQVRIEAPTVVPDYKLIKSIKLDGDRYWPLSVNMLHKGHYQKSIIKSGVIYVKRRDEKKSYEDDPYGKRNLL